MKLSRLCLLAAAMLLSTTIFSQVYEVSFATEEMEHARVIDVFMSSTEEESVLIRAINISIAYDSTCATFKGYAFDYSEAWSTYAERNGSIPIKDSLSYGGHTYNSRWIFGTAQMPRTEDVTLPAKGEKPLKILTVTFEKNCPTANLYLEDEKEYPVNQMGDANFKAAPWQIIRSLKVD